jgi:cobalt-precorrin 5A hydrolase
VARALSRRYAKREGLSEKLGRAGDELYLKEPLAEWTRAAFHSDAIVFYRACGIAVRAVAPFCNKQSRGPLPWWLWTTGQICDLPPFSTYRRCERTYERNRPKNWSDSRDYHGHGWRGPFCGGRVGKEPEAFLCGYKEAKAVSAALLAGGDVGFQSEFPVQDALPNGILRRNARARHFYYCGRENAVEVTLRLVPAIVVLGIGCRRGTNAQTIGDAVENALFKHGLAREAVARVSSIDIKRGEHGLRSSAKTIVCRL